MLIIEVSKLVYFDPKSFFDYFDNQIISLSHKPEY